MLILIFQHNLGPSVMSATLIGGIFNSLGKNFSWKVL